MRLKAPGTEKRAPADTKSRRVLRRTILIGLGLLLVALVGFRIFGQITGSPILTAPEEAVQAVVTPVQSGFSGVVNSVIEYLRKLKLRVTLESEYNKVKQENERLAYRAMLADELAYELSVYETLFGEVSVNESLNPIVCEVIDRESGNYFSVFTINKGSNDGISDFMAVTMDGALVGYTYSVTATKSIVRTIIDSEASIAALVQNSRDQGTVRGTLGIDGKPMCRMYYLPDDFLPRPGEAVVTSGVGMSFPKGIPIGIVRESTRGMDSNKSYIVIEPMADFEHIEYVIVLKYQPRAGEVSARDSGGEMTYTPLEPLLPVPTIQIGSDFYQLAPTPSPSPSPVPEDGDEGDTGDEGGITQPDITASPPPDDDSLEYQLPENKQTPSSDYGYTLPPTATPTPTLPPPEITVEDEEG